MIISYKTAQVLTLLVGHEMFKDTACVYLKPCKDDPQPVLRRRNMVIGEPVIAAPSWGELMQLIPHTIKDKKNVLKIEKFSLSWRVYYAAEKSKREKRVSQSFCGNNLAELLSKLWIQTQEFSLSLYQNEPQLLSDLIYHHYFPKGDYKQDDQSYILLQDNTVFGILPEPIDFFSNSLVELYEQTQSNFLNGGYENKKRWNA